MKNLKKSLHVGFMLLCLFGFYSQVRAEEQWKEVRNENGIVIEERKVFDSSMHQFRAKTVVQSSVGRILGLFGDYEHKLEWNPNVIERVLEQKSEQDIYMYQRISARMIADRDVILHIQVEPRLTEKAIYLTFESVHSTPHPEKNQPEIRGVVRMPFVKGYWKLKPTRQGQWTEVEYFVHSNPGGSVPSWMVNWVSKNMPYKSLQTLKEQVSIRSYPGLEKNLQQNLTYQAILSP